MHFHKIPYVANFEFARLAGALSLKTRRGRLSIVLRSGAGDIHHVGVRGRGWETSDNQHQLSTRVRKAGGGETRLELSSDARMRLIGSEGEVLLQSAPHRFFGQCGRASLFEFLREEGDRFYGLGEKWLGFEHSGRTTKFWNTDVWADFHETSFIQGLPAPDPVYLSVPYLILKRGKAWIGLLLDNARASFIATGLSVSIAEQMEVVPAGEEFARAVVAGVEEAKPRPRRVIHLGSEGGQPNLLILVGPTLPELTRKLQRLVGTTPRPPAWALGYHQCRWGYRSEGDLLALDAAFRRHRIPVDGLWLDIDYMRGFRVFTFEKRHFANPRRALAGLARSGRKVIPIIDPGIKREAGYDVYDRGQRAGAFCRNPQGGDYVGLVWPGETVFPDFSQRSGRAWWAREVKRFAGTGIFGAWLDMNDPATGPAENQDMLFGRGRLPHDAYHNQFALGMAAATRRGFLAAHPGDRPFLLSRSGFTGMSRYAAIWTGDNYSNYHHLKNSIATTLNLALSGIPFNGPDVGGFGGDASAPLIMDWFKAAFLFPVFRNHSIRESRRQEPWAFGPRVLRVLRHFIRLRYRFRPYLYQLFLRQERQGEAILRPLFYDFEETPALPLGLLDDQFLVGPSVLQAPFVEEGQSTRSVVLPGTGKWFDLAAGRWRPAGRRIRVKATESGTPIYVRDNSILPLARIGIGDHAFDAARVDFHVFHSGNGEAALEYEFDDGRSLKYRNGRYSRIVLGTRREGGLLTISSSARRSGCGAGDFTFTVPNGIRRVVIDGMPALPESSQGIAITPAALRTWRARSSRDQDAGLPAI